MKTLFSLSHLLRPFLPVRSCANAKSSSTTVGEGMMRAFNSGFGAEAITSGKWFKISPFGDFPYDEKITQFFGKAEADAMVAEFNSLSSQAGRLFRGLPIYIGHPDFDRETYPDDRRLGKITKLQSREDGLWGKAAWNSLGRENLAEEYWVFPSPFWIGPEAPGGFSPRELISVGLTNTPRITTSEPLANAAAAKKAKEDNFTKMNREKMMKELGLDSDATDEEIDAAMMAAIKGSKENKAANEKAENEKAENEKAENEKAENEKAENEKAANSKILSFETEKKAAQLEAANSLIALALVQGRITKADVATHEAAFKKDHIAGANGLKAITKSLNTEELKVGKKKVDVSDEKSRQSAVNSATHAVMKEQSLNYMDAYKVVKSDPAMKPVFEAMQTDPAAE